VIAWAVLFLISTVTFLFLEYSVSSVRSSIEPWSTTVSCSSSGGLIKFPYTYCTVRNTIRNRRMFLMIAFLFIILKLVLRIVF